MILALLAAFVVGFVFGMMAVLHAQTDDDVDREIAAFRRMYEAGGSHLRLYDQEEDAS